MDVRADGDIADNFWWRRTTLTRRGPLYDACVSVGLLVAATIVGALLDHPGLAPSIMIVYVLAVQLCAFFTWSASIPACSSLCLWSRLCRARLRWPCAAPWHRLPPATAVRIWCSRPTACCSGAPISSRLSMPWQRSWRVFRAVRSCGTAPTPTMMTCCRVRRTRPWATPRRCTS